MLFCPTLKFLWVRNLCVFVLYDLLQADKNSETKIIASTSTERQKRSQNLAPVLVIISGILWYFQGKLVPVLVFTGAAPLARQHQ